jgi:hypothetical protein
MRQAGHDFGGSVFERGYRLTGEASLASRGIIPAGQLGEHSVNQRIFALILDTAHLT